MLKIENKLVEQQEFSIASPTPYQ